MDNNLKPIFKRSIAMKLKNMGHAIEDAYVNLKNPKFVVYAFKKTDNLLKDLENMNKE